MEEKIVPSLAAGRSPTADELRRLKKKYVFNSLPLGIFLIISTCLMLGQLMIYMVFIKEHVRHTNPDMKDAQALVVYLALGCVIVIGLSKRYRHLKYFQVILVPIERVLEKESGGRFTYVAEFQVVYYGTVQNMSVPILKDAVSRVQNQGLGKVFYIGNVGYLIDRL